MHARFATSFFWLALWLLSACNAPQSALAGAGRDGQTIATLFWWMAGGAALVWCAVMGSTLYALAAPRRRPSRRAATWFIVGGGVILPTVLLTVLLVFGLSRLPGLLDVGSEQKPAIRVGAEQWWWRVQYTRPQGQVVELANELRLPVGRRTSIAVESPEVIHSLWVPALAGKVDAIPGRTTQIALEPIREGVFRGVCAEYCGVAHAHMNFDAIAMEPQAYEAWLQHQAEPALDPPPGERAQGRDAFLRLGCGACHTIRGTAADGRVGPDLTHLGSRLRIAGTVPRSESGLRAWLKHPGRLKPHVHMPSFAMVSDDEIAAIAAYLDGLD